MGIANLIKSKASKITMKSVLVCLALSVFLLMTVNATWADNGRTYKMPIQFNVTYIANQTSTLINVSYNAHMQSDFDDLEFWDSTETVELGYWFYNNTFISGNSVQVWVNTSILTALSNKTIYMYYGNSTAVTKSNISNVFIFADDFLGSAVDTTNKWSTTNGAFYSVGSGVLTITGNSYAAPLISQQSFSNEHITTGRVKVDDTAPDGVYIGFNGANTWMGSINSNFRIFGTGFVDNRAGTMVDNTYYRFIQRTSSNITNNGDFNWTDDSNVQKVVDYPSTGIATSGNFRLAQYQSTTMTVDWVYVRRYVPSEPIVIFGAEDSGSDTPSANVYINYPTNMTNISTYLIQINSSANPTTFNMTSISTFLYYRNGTFISNISDFAINTNNTLNKTANFYLLSGNYSTKAQYCGYARDNLTNLFCANSSLINFQSTWSGIIFNSNIANKSFQITEFIKVNGTNFTLGGNPYHIIGANFYYAVDYMTGTSWSDNGEQINNSGLQVIEGLNELQSLNVNVIRTWMLMQGGNNNGTNATWGVKPTGGHRNLAEMGYPGNYSEDYFVALDNFTSEASKRDIRIQYVPLNQWEAYGGKQWYLSMSSTSNKTYENATYLSDNWWTWSDQFYDDAEANTYFKNSLNYTLNRNNTITGVQYKDDPTIFSIMLMNEPRAKTTNHTKIAKWCNDTIAYAKTIDSKHLFTCGIEGLGFNETWGEGHDMIETYNNTLADYVTFAMNTGQGGYMVERVEGSTDNLFFCAVDSSNCNIGNGNVMSFWTSGHNYTYNSRYWSGVPYWTPKQARHSYDNWVEQNVKQANALNKPVMLQELVVDQSYSDATKNQLYTQAIDNFYPNGGDGVMFWTYNTDEYNRPSSTSLTGNQDDGYGFYVTDNSTLKALSASTISAFSYAVTNNYVTLLNNYKYNFAVNLNTYGINLQNCSLFLNVTNGTVATGYILNLTNTSEVLNGIDYIFTQQFAPPQYSFNWYTECRDDANIAYTSTPQYVLLQDDMPVVTLTSPANNQYFNSSPTLNYSVSDSLDITNCQLYVNDVLNLTDSTITKDVNQSFIPILNANGVYNWSIKCTDIGNNIGYSTITNNFTFDITAPVVVLNTPSNNTKSFEPVQNLTVNITDGIGIKNATLYINNVYNSTISFVEGTLSAVVGIVVTFVDGIYNWFYDVVDWAGNHAITSPNNLTIDTFPNTTFNYQIPADINSVNAFTVGVNISYNISDATGLDLSSIKLYEKINSSTRDIVIFSNGTGYSGYNEKSYVYNDSRTFVWTLADNAIYPGTYNHPSTEMEALTKTKATLSGNNQYLAMEFLNVTNTTHYNIFEVYANSSNILRAYYCNSSYAFSSSPDTSPRCVLIDTLAINNPYNHSHTANSNHQFIPISINTTSGTTGTVKVTPTSYLLLRGNKGAGAGVDYYYISNTTRTNAFRVSTNGGNSWTGQTYTVDAHIHQFSDTESLFYFQNITDISGNTNTTVEKQDLYQLAGLPPQPGVITSPTNGFYEYSISINYTAWSSPNAYDISYYNISLLNIDLSYNNSIANNNSNLLNYTWNTTLYADGNFIIKVEGVDAYNQSSFTYSDNFTIDKNSPNGTLISPANNSYLNYTLVNFTANISDNIGIANYTLKIYTQNLSGGFCYQESATTSTICGGLSTGVYDFSNTLNNGNWTDELESVGEYNINYTKPAYALNSSLWLIGNSSKVMPNPAIFSYTNYSIPIDCWNYDASILSLKIGMANVRQFYSQCYNGTSWTNISWAGPYGLGAVHAFAEESMWWNMTQVGNSVNETTFAPVSNTLTTIVGIVVSLVDGIYNWFYNIVDTTNHYFTSTTYTTTIDTISPNITITYPLPINYITSPTEFNVSFKDTNLNACWWSNGTANYTLTCGTNVTGLESLNGTNTWIAYANDSAGTVSSSSVTFSYLSYDVNMSLISPGSYFNYTTAQSSVLFNYTMTPINFNITNSTIYLYNADNGNVINATSRVLNTNSTTNQAFTLYNLGYGNYSWNVRGCGYMSDNQSLELCKFAPLNNSLKVVNQSVWNNVYRNATPEIYNTIALKTNVSIGYGYNFAYCNFSVENPVGNLLLSESKVSTISGIVITSPAVYLNQSGKYLANVTCYNDIGNYSTSYLNISVPSYILTTSPDTTGTYFFAAVHEKNETNSFNVTMYDNVNSSVIFTATTDINNRSNFSLSLTSYSIQLNDSDRVSNPIRFGLFLNASNQIENGTYSGNITLRNTTLNLEYVIKFLYGISPPSAVLEIYNSSNTGICTNDYTSNCRNINAVNLGSTITQTYYVRNNGFFNATNCFPLFEGTLSAVPWITFSNPYFDLPMNSSKNITVYFSPTNLVSNGNNDSFFYVQCNNGDLLGHSITSAPGNRPVNIITVTSSNPVTPQGQSGGVTPTAPSGLVVIQKIATNLTIFPATMDFVLAKGSVAPRIKTFSIYNQNAFSINASLECKEDPSSETKSDPSINICDYVKFSKTNITISQNEQVPTNVDLYVYTPPNASLGDQYKFTIFVKYVTSDKKYQEYVKMSASAEVPWWAEILKYSNVPGQGDISQEEKTSYPVFIVAFFLAFVVSLIFGLILGRWYPVTALLIAIVIFFLLFGLFVYWL